jgi:hypothetical protein
MPNGAAFALAVRAIGSLGAAPLAGPGALARAAAVPGAALEPLPEYEPRLRPVAWRVCSVLGPATCLPAASGWLANALANATCPASGLGRRAGRGLL